MVGVVGDVATGSAQVDDRGRLRGRVAERADVRHHIVTQLLLVTGRLLEVDVVEVTGHLVDLALFDVQAELLLGLGQFQPEPPPRAELLLGTEQLRHLGRGVSLDQRTGVDTDAFAHGIILSRLCSSASELHFRLCCLL
jgi:hypothetical protein